MTVRHVCVISSCPWEYTPDDTPPMNLPILAFDQLVTHVARHRARQVEQGLAAHLNTHTRAELATEIARLRNLTPEEPRP